MKTKKSIVVTAGLLIGFVIGLMVGITLTNPGLSLMEAAGTIGKVDQYRNVRVTEKDIELRNEPFCIVRSYANIQVVTSDHHSVMVATNTGYSAKYTPTGFREGPAGVSG